MPMDGWSGGFPANPGLDKNPKIGLFGRPRERAGYVMKTMMLQLLRAVFEYNIATGVNLCREPGFRAL